MGTTTRAASTAAERNGQRRRFAASMRVRREFLEIIIAWCSGDIGGVTSEATSLLAASSLMQSALIEAPETSDEVSLEAMEFSHFSVAMPDGLQGLAVDCARNLSYRWDELRRSILRLEEHVDEVSQRGEAGKFVPPAETADYVEELADRARELIERLDRLITAAGLTRDYEKAGQVAGDPAAVLGNAGVESLASALSDLWDRRNAVFALDDGRKRPSGASAVDRAMAVLGGPGFFPIQRVADAMGGKDVNAVRRRMKKVGVKLTGEQKRHGRVLRTGPYCQKEGKQPIHLKCPEAIEAYYRQ